MPDKPGESRLPVDTWKEFDQNVITHSAAHHLMAIYDLLGHLGYARVSDIARRLNITRGSVSISLQPLKKSGLIIQDENRHLRLSPTGQALVAGIKSKHEVVLRLFAEVLRVPAEQAEIDACKLEHLLSNETARKMQTFLRFLDSDGARGREFVAAWRAAAEQGVLAPSQGPRGDTERAPQTTDPNHPVPGSKR
jgi:DtxR family transcriptional regulator, Mn-dependent transcriptional regulator